MSTNNIFRRLPKIILAFVMVLGMFVINLSYSQQAFAANKSNAEADTYIENRNPNLGGNMNGEDLVNNGLDAPETDSAKGESIYESVVERVNNQKDTYTIDSSSAKTKSKS